jgi:hypothetical protein
MTSLPHLRRELRLAARRLDREQVGFRRWLRSGRRLLVVIPIVVVALGGLAFAATHTLSTSRTTPPPFKVNPHRPFAQTQYRRGHCPAHVIAFGAPARAAKPGMQLSSRLASPIQDATCAALVARARAF